MNTRIYFKLTKKLNSGLGYEYNKILWIVGKSEWHSNVIDAVEIDSVKKNKYVKIKNYIYEAASVFQNNGIYYANLNYISNPDVFGIDVSKVLNI